MEHGGNCTQFQVEFMVLETSFVARNQTPEIKRHVVRQCHKVCDPSGRVHELDIQSYFPRKEGGGWRIRIT
jgi:hypothetical protein